MRFESAVGRALVENGWYHLQSAGSLFDSNLINNASNIHSMPIARTLKIQPNGSDQGHVEIGTKTHQMSMPYLV